MKADAALQLSSPAFQANDAIPPEHTCDGANRSPALDWTGVPGETKSLVLIVDDPDAPDPKAPRQTFVHWVLYDIPPSARGLAAGGAPPAGAREGLNDRGDRGYTGPCPPVGRHRYFFKLYALDRMLGDLGGATRAAVEAAMRDHVIGRAEIVGTYERAG
jgi:Raf kinase inhibitor-like YbhB/YbcL family protein